MPFTRQGTELLRIHRTENGDVVFTLSGRIDEENIAELEALIAAEGKDRRIVLDLKDMTLTGRGWQSFFVAQCRQPALRCWCDPYVAGGSRDKTSRDKTMEASAVGLIGENAEQAAFIKETTMTTLDLIGSSPKFRALMAEVTRVAPVDSAVLIQGETGTGKEVIARSIRDAGPRRNRFVARIAQRFRAHCWRANCSATNRAPSPARGRKQGAI